MRKMDPSVKNMSASYLIIEAILGVIFLYCVLAIAAEDWRTMIVPDRFLIVIAASGWAQSAVKQPVTADNILNVASELAFRSLFLGAVSLLTALLYKVLRGRDGLGLGDVKLLAVGGAWLPIAAALNAAGAAAIAALLVTVALDLAHGKTASMMRPIPFATFLAPALWLAWCLEQFSVNF